MDQNRTTSAHVPAHAHAAAHAAADRSPRTDGGRTRLPRRAAGGVFAVGVLASCLASVGGTAFAATGTRTAPAPVTVSGSAPRTSTEQQDVDAFTSAGYTSTDALDLAVIWSNPSIQNTKVTAGAFLLGHEALPFAPGAAPKTYTRAQDVAAFVTADYDYSDALELAAVWGSPSVAGAKVTAGAKLLAGADLPKIPKAFTRAQDVAAFTASGYDHSDALELAAVWGSSSVAGAKVTAGAKLLAGADLPKIPKTFTRAQDVAAFTASGYDHHDAVRLAHLWHSGSVHATKVQAGIKLLAGDSLPIRP